MGKRWLQAGAVLLLFGVAVVLWVFGARGAGRPAPERGDQASSFAAGRPSMRPPPMPQYGGPSAYPDVTGAGGPGGDSSGSPPSPESAKVTGGNMVRCATHPFEIRDRSSMVEVEHKGETYYVCCDDCAARFRADPEFWIRGLREIEKTSAQ